MTSDGELLRCYTESNSEDAFAELVRRHLDLVYSAALRQVNGDAHLAQDVTQSVFTDLARKAGSLTDRQALAGWLYTGAHYGAAKAVRGEQRRHNREQEAHDMHTLLHDPGPNPDWEGLRPVLDSAMHELSEADREVILLRYFESQPHAEIGKQLGLSDDSARKRIERVLEKLRIILSRRGITTSAAALSIVLSTNAVQAAPVGLAVTISTAAALGGTTIATAATATATKAMAMTTLQKTIIGATLAAAVGTGVYEANQASNLRDQVQTLQQQQSVLTDELAQLRGEHDQTSSQLTAVREENERLRKQPAEALKLRGEVSRLREETRKLAQTKVVTNPEAASNNPFVQSVLSLAARAIELGELVNQHPEKRIPEFQLTTEQDWIEAAKKFPADSESDPQKILNELRFMAKQKFYHAVQPALRAYIEAHQGQLPSDVLELKPYFNPPMDEAILQRYKMANTGDASRFDWFRNGKVPSYEEKNCIIMEKGPPADKDDDLYRIGLGMSFGGRK